MRVTVRPLNASVKSITLVNRTVTSAPLRPGRDRLLTAVGNGSYSKPDGTRHDYLHHGREYEPLGAFAVPPG